MTNSVGFASVSYKDAQVLILGSLPGAESLKQQQYYAKKQNSFWKIMGELAGALPALSYAERLECLKKNHIALWDVCASAQRIGSLDSNILSPVPNDFATFFKTHPDIKRVCFNGQAAEKLFRRLVMPVLPKKVLAIPRVMLPSTSPAHAGMRVEEKVRIWKEALKEHFEK